MTRRPQQRRGTVPPSWATPGQPHSGGGGVRTPQRGGQGRPASSRCRATMRPAPRPRRKTTWRTCPDRDGSGRVQGRRGTRPLQFRRGAGGGHFQPRTCSVSANPCPSARAPHPEHKDNTAQVSPHTGGGGAVPASSPPLRLRLAPDAFLRWDPSASTPRIPIPPSTAPLPSRGAVRCHGGADPGRLLKMRERKQERMGWAVRRRAEVAAEKRRRRCHSRRPSRREPAREAAAAAAGTDPRTAPPPRPGIRPPFPLWRRRVGRYEWQPSSKRPVRPRSDLASSIRTPPHLETYPRSRQNH
mmetsp:Transcript_21345/g.62185  ORF Transcript_21345/g.62185 Transcript_21345/m.62185 type:complete len:300 (-) Transcript_21345:1493-2392(-)